MLANQRATDLYLEGNSNAIKAGQKVKMIIGAENALIFYISHAHLIKKRVQVCYYHNMPMRLVKTAPIWSTNMELDKKGIKIRFLTDIRNEKSNIFKPAYTSNLVCFLTYLDNGNVGKALKKWG